MESSSPVEINLDFGGSSIVKVPNNEVIENITDLKNFILKLRRLPVRWQLLNYQGNRLDNEDMIHELLTSDDGNQERVVTIHVAVISTLEPITFTSDLVCVPPSEFSDLAYVREMKEYVTESLGICWDSIVLTSGSEYEPLNNDLMLHEIGLERNEDSSRELRVWVRVWVDMYNNHEKKYEYVIKNKTQTIEEMRKDLLIVKGYKENGQKLSLHAQPDLEQKLRKDTLLLDLPKMLLGVPNGRVIFDKENSLCVLQ